MIWEVRMRKVKLCYTAHGIVIMIGVLLFGSTLARAVSPSPTPTPMPSKDPGMDLEHLTDDEVLKILERLNAEYVDSSKLGEKELHKATVFGLLARLNPGVSLVWPDALPPVAFPFLAEILEHRMGYLRLGKLTKGVLAEMDSALANFSSKKINAIILDLRGIPYSADFDLAADFAKRFSPRGKILFSLQRPAAKQERIFTSDRDPVFSGILVVLTDADTAGASEALAGVLRKTVQAIIVGTRTAGEAVEFTSTPLGTGRELRVAVSCVVISDTAPLFPNGVEPDVRIEMDPELRDEVFRQSKEKGVSQFVFLPARTHINETSLIHNTNPEIDGSESDRPSPQPLQDTVLQRGVDIVTAILFYQKRN